MCLFFASPVVCLSGAVLAPGTLTSKALHTVT